MYESKIQINLLAAGAPDSCYGCFNGGCSANALGGACSGACADTCSACSNACYQGNYSRPFSEPDDKM